MTYYFTVDLFLVAIISNVGPERFEKPVVVWFFNDYSA